MKGAGNYTDAPLQTTTTLRRHEAPQSQLREYFRRG
jgi:hypothetical protein